MTTDPKSKTNLMPLLLLFGLFAIGITALTIFWNQLLQPGQFSNLSLPLVAFVAGLAATFDPCAMPTLPAFLALMSGEESSSKRYRLKISLSTSLGAFSLVLVIGILIGILGEGAKSFMHENGRWVQLALGAFLVIVSLAHIFNYTDRMPYVAPVMEAGQRIWQDVISNPTPRGGYLFGAGFVLVGIG